MENASKALLLAASILVGLIILSLGIYLVNTFKSFSQNYNDSMEIQRMQQFNAQFTAFSTRSNISIHEIVTLANYAKEFNDNNNLKSGDSQYIKVIIKVKNKTFNLTDPEDCSRKSGFQNKTKYGQTYELFINSLLDGTYIYNLYGNSVEKEGQYEYDYITKTENGKEKKIRQYYNCYKCTKYEVNSQTGRVESITFEFQESYTENHNK